MRIFSKSMKDVRGAGCAGSSPSFLGRERAAVNVDVTALCCKFITEPAGRPIANPFLFMTRGVV